MIAPRANHSAMASSLPPGGEWGHDWQSSLFARAPRMHWRIIANYACLRTVARHVHPPNLGSPS